MHALLHGRLKLGTLIGLALAVTLTIAARQPQAPQLPGAATTVFSDFDSDNHPDEIELISSGTSKSINVRLSHSSSRHLFFDSDDSRAGTLLAADIDLDQDLDLIWITPNKPALSRIWLGDGHGNFEAAPEPARYLNAVAALEASSRSSNLDGGADSARQIAVTVGTTSIDADSGEVRRIAFTLPSLLDRSTQPGLIHFYGLTSSERGPPLHS